MIGWLSGTLLKKAFPDLLLVVQGVGYELQASMTTFSTLPDEAAVVSLYVHCNIREDAHTLYGFYSELERALFRSLIKVNGVGPKLALAILSSMSIEEFIQAVQRKEAQRLVKIPGVGKKTAERLVIEMRDKISNLSSLENLSAGVEKRSKTQASSILTPLAGSVLMQEAIDALETLGYRPQEAAHALKIVEQQCEQKNDSISDLAVEDLIRLALKNRVTR